MSDVVVYGGNGCSNENTIQLLFTIFINPLLKHSNTILASLIQPL